MAYARNVCEYENHLPVFNQLSVRQAKSSAMSKEKIINIRVDAELKKRARRLAEDDGRSLSNWILRLIEAEIKKSGKALSSKKKNR